VPGLSDVIEIAAGYDTSYALRRDGTLWAWGQNFYGTVGDGTQERRLSPVLVTGVPFVQSISAGRANSHARTATDTHWTWGANVAGQLGIGSIGPPRLTPSAGPVGG
jgi:alpha-tubulin suppressor-like RCC1 family protein